ncbi:MAG: radical SAM protein [Thermodesulfovibrionales bacterium]|nr:radical SAM protein [Thermodesulfovibrionales bacterium]
MDFLFISMPYARFISRWFSNMPNINLGIMQALLTEKGKKVKSFHFHLEFLPFIRRANPRVWDQFLAQSEQFGVEYMGLDYLFASLLFDDRYRESEDLFKERLESIGLTLTNFDTLREITRSFIEYAFGKISPHLQGANLVGFSCSHYQLSSSLLLCSMVKKVYPDVQTVFGGKDCSGTFASELLKNMPYVDFVGTSECELTVESLLDHIKDGSKEIVNVVSRGENGTIQKAPSRPNTSLNRLPLPSYEMQDFPIPRNELIMPIEFGRGCPWKRCTFCPDESYNILCQAKSAEKIQDEIGYYLDISPDLRNFFILDSDALKDPKTILEVSKFLEEKGLTFHYAEFRAERMNRDVLSAILHFGTWASNFQIGIETFSDRMLQLMNKGVTALKNVEVLKAAAELGVPVQFNLFTCYPGMSTQEMNDNIRVMDLIAHILVYDNILIYPGEFYLPTDCPVFMNPEQYSIRKHAESIFSVIFKDFPMPSYSNYPYPYQFDNDDEQYRLSTIIREKVDAIKSKNRLNTYMTYKDISDGLEISICLNGNRTSHILTGKEKSIYLSALEKIREAGSIAQEFDMPVEDVSAMLQTLEQKGLVLLSPDRKSFLSLATKA